MSDEIVSSEEETCASNCSTRPASRSSVRSRASQPQHANFNNFAVESSSGIPRQSSSHPGAGHLFQYMPPPSNQPFGFEQRQGMDHSMLNASDFSAIDSSDMNEAMITPRPEYLPSVLFDHSFNPLNSSAIANEWLAGAPSNHGGLHGFPFPESFDVSPLSAGSVEPQYQVPQPPSRKTTIVLEDIEEDTLSKVMNILIQEKAKVRMETTHSDRQADHRK